MPKTKDKVNISVMTSKTGMVVFEGKTLQITGFMGMVSMTVPVAINVEVAVFPKKTKHVEVAEIPYSEGYDEYTEPDLKGSLSSDVKEIREYRPGDRMSRIHWKISAKIDELAVKEMERTSVMSLVLVPEFDKDLIEDTVETLDALCREGKLTDYSVIVHALKSNARTIGAEKLAEEAASLEALSKSGEGDEVLKGHGPAMKLYEETVMTIRSILSEDGDDGEDDTDSEVMEFSPEEGDVLEFIPDTDRGV